MATLEVHDGRGRVERVRIAHDQPVMFGSSPKCDVVLGGDGVLPFHGRVRWREQKKTFKVDASPEAEYILVNGQKMATLYNLQAISRGAYADPRIYANDTVVVGDSKARRLFDDIVGAATLISTPLTVFLQN